MPTRRPRTASPSSSPSGSGADWSFSSTRTEAGWEAQAHWWGAAGEPPTDGPLEVVIRLADDHSPVQRQKGITSGVMRRLERHVTAMADELQTSRDYPSVGAYEQMVRTYVRQRLEDLPPSPHADAERYYSLLLSVLDDLTERGYPEPVNLLASVLDAPKGTIKTRLNTARQRRAAKDQT